jgi:dihydropteroate synthase
LVNDVSGGTLDEAMFETIANLRVPYILMHMRGDAQTHTKHTHYAHLVADVLREMQQQIAKLRKLGVTDIIGDVGFGFAKTAEQNFELLQHFEVFEALEVPLLAGLSRKSMIWRKLSIPVEQALNGTTVLNTIALLKGAAIVRVHDVREAVEAVQLVAHTFSVPLES